MSDTTDEQVVHLPKQGEEVKHEHVGGINVVKKVHADGVVDLIDAHAIGGDFNDMPKGYYSSVSFIATFVVSQFNL
jgi:hypothetical protein